jgi:hypothetical protein
MCAPTHRQADKVKAGFLDQVEVFLLHGQTPFAFFWRWRVTGKPGVVVVSGVEAGGMNVSVSRARTGVGVT